MGEKEPRTTEQQQAKERTPNIPPNTIARLGPSAAEPEPSNNETEKSTKKIETLLKRLKQIGEWFYSYKFRQLRNDPKAWIEIIALGTVILYTISAWKQASVMNLTLEEIRKQTPKIAESADAAKQSSDLNVKITEGAFHATIFVQQPTVNARTLSDNQTVILEPFSAIQYRNDGRVAAHDLSVNFALETRSIPKGEVLATQKIIFWRGQIAVSPQFAQPNSIDPTWLGSEDFQIPGWDKFLPLFERGHATAIVSGTFSYEDGFGRQITEHVCFQMIRYRQLQAAGGKYQGAQWPNCGQVPLILHTYAVFDEQLGKKNGQDSK